MRSDVSQSNEESVAEGETDEFDTWLALQTATDKQRANLIADVVGPPKVLRV